MHDLMQRYIKAREATKVERVTEDELRAILPPSKLDQVRLMRVMGTGIVIGDTRYELKDER